MPKYKLEFFLVGPARSMWIPNKSNPVEAKDLQDVLQTVADNIEALPAKTTGVRIEQVQL